MRKAGALVFLVALVCTSSPSLAAEYTVWPTAETNTTGHSDFAAKHDGTVLIYGGATTGTVRKDNGYLKFDVSAIPDSTTVTAIVWNFYVHEAHWPYWSVIPVDLDPVPITATAALLWDDIETEAHTGYYNLQNEDSTYAPGWKTLVLGGTASADMTSALNSTDYFVFGAASRDTGGNTYYLEIDGHTDTNAPYLVVNDELPPPPPGCADAIVISPVPGTSSYSGDTTLALDQFNCTAPCVGYIDHSGGDVDYQFTLPGGCEVCVTLNQSDMTWNGGVYMVTDCADVNGTCVAGASGWLAGGPDEAFCYSDTATETYYIIVDGRTGGGSGEYRLDVQVSCLAGPTGLTCTDAGDGIELNWTNNDTCDTLEVYVNGVLEATLAGTATTFPLYGVEKGYTCIHLCAVLGTDVQCTDECCLIYGYDNVEVLWDFEVDDGGFIVDGTEGWQWGTLTLGPCSGTADGNVWGTRLDSAYSNSSCWLLDSASIWLGEQGGFICIDHCYDIENGWDGGVVWFTTDDDRYYSFEPVEGTDGVITAIPGCTWVAGHNGFTGSSGGWVTDCWDFTDPLWQDQEVKIRLAFGSDSTVASYSGWMIDNITIYNNRHHPEIFCDYTVTPLVGTVPFGTTHRITLINNLVGGQVFTRRFAAQLAVTIGNGTSYNPWRAGYTNVAPSSTYFTQFPVEIPALSSLIGYNSFVLWAMDVTPAPYNQPPYPPSGLTDTRTNVVVANAP